MLTCSSLFNGCLHHGHLKAFPPCPLLPPTANEETLNFLQQSYGSLAEKLTRQVEYFKSERIKVNSVWECEWLAKFGHLEEEEKAPTDRLIPREGLR